MKDIFKISCINYLFILFFLGSFLDNSHAQFSNSTKKYITVTNPTSSTTWIKGETVIIQWHSNISANANVRVLLYRGNNLVSTITNATPNYGYYTYSVPSSLIDGTNYRVRVFDIANPSVGDFSDFFSITTNTPSITITNPTSSTVWTAGQNESIQWTSNFSSSANLRIFLYEGNNLVAQVANSTPNTGAFTYSVPTHLVNSSIYRLQIFDIANPAALDYSDFFTINNGTPSINITNPISSTVWTAGQNESIQWTSNFSSSANLRIFLYEGTNLVAQVANSIPNTGTFTYSVPTHLVNSSIYRLQIFDIANPAAVDYSDFFTINNGTPSITITNPISSTVWDAGQNESIQWTSNFSSSANLRIFLYEGTSLVAQVASSTPNTGTFTYSVPTNLGNSSIYRLQIFDIANPSAVDYSDFFTINNNGSKSKRLSNTSLGNLEDLKEKSNIESILLAPNPQVKGVASAIFIQSNQTTTAQVIVSDITGKVLYQKAIQLTEGNNQIYTNPIREKGVYLVSIQTTNSIKSLKLVVE